MWLQFLCSELDVSLKRVQRDDFSIKNRNLENFTNN